MEIEHQDISNVLSLYGISTDIAGFSVLESSFDDGASEGKFIMRADLPDGNTLVIRFIRQDDYPRDKTEAQSRFAEQLRERGVFTPRQYKSGDISGGGVKGNSKVLSLNYRSGGEALQNAYDNDAPFCVVYPLRELAFDVTVEDYIGKTGGFPIDAGIMYKIGQLTGQMHSISEKDKLRINADTLYNLMGYNEFSGYGSFKRFGDSGFIDRAMFSRICTAYANRMSRIEAVWDHLPSFAVQGDTCTYNMTYDGGALGIFDYNNAGDGTLVYDMIVHGFFAAYHSSKGQRDDERAAFFRSYYDGYVSRRPLSGIESSVFNDIFAVTKGMHHLRINVKADSLGGLIERGENTNALLEEIYSDITGGSFL